MWESHGELLNELMTEPQTQDSDLIILVWGPGILLLCYCCYGFPGVTKARALKQTESSAVNAYYLICPSVLLPSLGMDSLTALKHRVHQIFFLHRSNNSLIIQAN